MTRLLPLFALLLAGCPSKDSAVMCTEIAMVSVTVHVEDSAGVALDGATVTYSVDGGAAAPCDAGTTTGEFFCAYEQSGTFELHASVPGYSEGSATLDIDADECHVLGQAHTFSLTALPD